MQHAKQMQGQSSRSNSELREELYKRYNVSVPLPQIKNRRNSLESALDNKSKYKNSFKYETKQMLNTGIIKTRSKSALDDKHQQINTELSNNKYDLETAMELALSLSDRTISKIRQDYQECMVDGQKHIKQLVVIQQRLLAEESYRRGLKTVTSIQQLKNLHQTHQRKADHLNYLTVPDILFTKRSNGEMVNVADILPVYEIKINNGLMNLNSLLEQEDWAQVVVFNQITDPDNLDFTFEQSLKQLAAFFSPEHEVVRQIAQLYRIYNGVRKSHPLPTQSCTFTINKKFCLNKHNCRDPEVLGMVFKNYAQLDESQCNTVHNLVQYVVQANHTMCIHNIPLEPIRDVIDNFARYSGSLSNSSIQHKVNAFVRNATENKREMQQVQNVTLPINNVALSQNIDNGSVLNQSNQQLSNQLSQSGRNQYTKPSELNVAGSKSSVSDPLNKRMYFENVKFSGNTDLFNSDPGSQITDKESAYPTAVQINTKQVDNKQIESKQNNDAYNLINNKINDKQEDTKSVHQSNNGFDENSGSAGFDDQSDEEKSNNQMKAYEVIQQSKNKDDDDDFD